MTLLECLPKTEQNFAYEFIKKLVRAWDPDWTKLTPSEKEFENGEIFLEGDEL